MLSKPNYLLQITVVWAAAVATMAAATLSSSAGQKVIIGGLGHNSSICLAHLNMKSGHLSITDKWAKAAGPSPAFIAWSSSSDSSSSAVRNILIANHAGSNGEAITAVQLYPPYAKRSASVRTDDPCHIALHPSGRCDSKNGRATRCCFGLQQYKWLLLMVRRVSSSTQDSCFAANNALFHRQHY
jgi:hypothetical protein